MTTTRVVPDEIQNDELSWWPSLPQRDLVERLARVVAELFTLYQELSFAELEERKAKINGFASSQGESVTARDRDAAANALPATLQAIEFRGRIAALENAKDFGQLLLHLGG